MWRNRWYSFIIFSLSIDLLSLSMLTTINGNMLFPSISSTDDCSLSISFYYHQTIILILWLKTSQVHLIVAWIKPEHNRKMIARTGVGWRRLQQFLRIKTKRNGKAKEKQLFIFYYLPSNIPKLAYDFVGAITESSKNCEPIRKAILGVNSFYLLFWHSIYKWKFDISMR